MEGASAPSPSLRDRPRSVGTRPPRSSAGVPGWGTGLSPRSTAGGPGHSVKGPMAPHTYAARAIGAGCPPGLRTLPANQGERRRPGHPSMPRAHPPVRNHLYMGSPGHANSRCGRSLLRAEHAGSPKGLWALAQIRELKGGSWAGPGRRPSPLVETSQVKDTAQARPRRHRDAADVSRM